MLDLYIPEIKSVNNDSVWKWFQNIEKEINEGCFLEEESAYIKSYYKEAGLLTCWRKPFFKKHYIESFCEAAKFLMGSSVDGVILDLGCGTGTQSLFFALCGLRVVSVDMDEVALTIFQKRIDEYQKVNGKDLDITILNQNTFDINYNEIGPIMGVYSMFAFNMMQPSSELVGLIGRGIVEQSRLAVIDGNNQSIYSRICWWRRRNVWSPSDFSSFFKNNGWKIEKHQGKIAIPPQVWICLPYKLIRSIDNLFVNNWLFPVSHQILAEKK